MLRIYIIGICILLIAIISNVIANKLAINTWYDFGPLFFKKGFAVMKKAGIINCLWLFVIYPLILSLGYLIGDKLYKLF